MQKNYEYFIMLAEKKNFTKAAEALFISQPALSKYIGRLEESLGTPLFDRTSTPLRLTYAGELYLQYIKDQKRSEDILSRRLEEIRTEERGQIHLGLSSYRGSCLLPEVLPLFSSRYPHISICLTEGSAPFLFHELFHERIQFCISNPVDTLNYSLLDYESLFREEILLAVSETYPGLLRFVSNSEEVPERNRSQEFPLLDISRLQEEPFFMTSDRQSMTYIIESALSSRRFHLSNVFRSSNLTTLINLAAAGLGFVFVPRFSLRQAYFPKNLLFFRLENLPLFWEHAVFYKRGTYLSCHCVRFIDTLKEIYGSSDRAELTAHTARIIPATKKAGRQLL